MDVCVTCAQPHQGPCELYDPAEHVARLTDEVKRLRTGVKTLAIQIEAAHAEALQTRNEAQGQRREHAYQGGRASGLRMALQKLRAINPETT